MQRITKLAFGVGRVVPAAAVAAPVIFVALVAWAARPLPKATAETLPAVGSQLDTTFVGGIQGIKTVIIVSDECTTCRKRWRGYERYVRRHSDHLLVIAHDSTAPFFAERISSVHERIVFVSPQDLRATLHVRVVPSYLRISGSGEVNEGGTSNIGALSAALYPLNWLDAWRIAID
jgi:hypothetical protein